MIDGYWAPLTLIQTMNNQAGNVFAAGQAAMSLLQRLWCTTLPREPDPAGRRLRRHALPEGHHEARHRHGHLRLRDDDAPPKNPEAAWKFLEFMYGEEGMKIITVLVLGGAGDAALLQQPVLARPARRRRTTTRSSSTRSRTARPRRACRSTRPARSARPSPTAWSRSRSASPPSRRSWRTSTRS